MVEFGRTLTTMVQDKWKPHAVAYNSLKHALVNEENAPTKDCDYSHANSTHHITDKQIASYFRLYDDSVDRLSAFYEERSIWAEETGTSLEKQVNQCLFTPSNGGGSHLVAQCVNFSKDIDLVLEFLDLNATAFSKIMKKFDKLTSLSLREAKLDELKKTHPYIYEGGVLREYKKRSCEWVSKLDKRLNAQEEPVGSTLLSHGRKPSVSRAKLSIRNSLILGKDEAESLKLEITSSADETGGESSKSKEGGDDKGSNVDNPQECEPNEGGQRNCDLLMRGSSVGSTKEDTIVQEIVERVNVELCLLKADSPYFDSHLDVAHPPAFSSREVDIERLLGQGEFCKIYEVTRFDVPESCHICFLHRGYHDNQPFEEMCTSVKTSKPDRGVFETVEDETTKELKVVARARSPSFHDYFSFKRDANTDGYSDLADLETDHNDETQYRRITRGFMKDHCLRGEKSRYAIKRLRNSLVGEDIMNAAIDLAREGEFLATLNHPNIIKIRATIEVPGHPKFSLVLDRLAETLDARIDRWRLEKKQSKGKFMGIIGKKKKELKKLWLDRLLVGYDLSGALEYLHNRSILHRDIKAENVGFDVRGDLKLFDLGLSKELKPCDRDVGGGDVYQSSGLVGTRRYMSPEVVKILPYGLSTDVYSFAICFHEVLSLSPAFDNYTREQHYKEVVSEGKRPKLPKSWPEMIKDLFRRSWHDDASKRPSMEAVRQLIRNALPEDHKIDERANDLMLRSSRSTSAHGFNPLDLSVN